MKQNVLLTPGPLTTSKEVKQAMQFDLGTRDQEYQGIVQHVQEKLLGLAHASRDDYACILLQGSGTYGVESVLTSTVGSHEKVLILSNGAYGERMMQICEKANVPYISYQYAMTEALPILEIEEVIKRDDVTHVAYIHSETTAGVLNDIHQVQALIKQYHKISIVDAMSSFGGIDMDITELDIDYLITSSNKCLHGVPGIAIIFAKINHLKACAGISKSLSLDLYEQYQYMNSNPGSFRFTSPTHVILALNEAIDELIKAGGIPSRTKRYQLLQNQIEQMMFHCGFETLVEKKDQAPIITTYLIPEWLDFQAFYDYFKDHGFLLYSGKLPGVDAFRIGNIGNILDKDIAEFQRILKEYKEKCDGCTCDNK